MEFEHEKQEAEQKRKKDKLLEQISIVSGCIRRYDSGTRRAVLAHSIYATSNMFGIGKHMITEVPCRPILLFGEHVYSISDKKSKKHSKKKSSVSKKQQHIQDRNRMRPVKVVR